MSNVTVTLDDAPPITMWLLYSAVQDKASIETHSAVQDEASHSAVQDDASMETHSAVEDEVRWRDESSEGRNCLEEQPTTVLSNCLPS